jgi:hypothetical protein
MAKNSEDERIKAEIQRAINITKDLDEPYRVKAFEIILSRRLVSSSTIENTQEQKEAQRGDTKPQELSLENKIEGFARKCGITSEQLKNVYHFDPDKPLFVVNLNDNDAIKQVEISRYLLVAYEEVYGQEWVSLRPVLEEHRVGSLNNLARNIDRSEVFRKKGQKKNMVYKLADTTKIETFNLIRGLATSGSN